MGISSKTRKNIWSKSANRCSICKIELFSKKTDRDEFNIGEECHIISSKLDGPRHKPNIDNYDISDNLILLCRNHHKEIDELTDTYSEELLRYIKLSHENWVKNTLDKSINKGKSNKPRFLARITSGKELLNIVSDSYGYRTDYDEVENEEDAKYIGGVLQDLTDYGDLSGMVEVYDKVQMGLQLNELLKDLEQKGYYLFGEKNIEKMKFKNGETDNWSIATLVIKKKDNEEVIKINLDKKK
ncbi:HNH endonuclease [Ancylomarina longa]|uniref:HNH endonuclease n=2 Tax=Ancylomarina longa TaxID=2487017 RepID=A0A434AZG2_9BACT|nr:HNH endonuclease [Ancylomarina longa]